MARKTGLNPNNRIREFRIAAGIHQKELAKTVGIGHSTLVRYESPNFNGMIPAQIKNQLAEALDKDVFVIFPNPGESNLSRRELITGGIAGASMLTMNIPAFGTPFLPNLFGSNRENYKSLSKDEIQRLGDANFSAWELFDSLQVNSQIDYVQAVAQGTAVTLFHLGQTNLLPMQKSVVLNFLGDIYLLLGRINQEIQNYGSADQYYRQAKMIADETGNADLKVAFRQRYGFMLVDQERYNAALVQGKAAIEETKKASYPLWAEARYLAAEAYVRTGDFKAAESLIYETRTSNPGPSPQFWFGKLRATPSAPIIREVTANIVANKNREAMDVASKCIEQVKRDEPDNIRWLTRVQILYATALWQFGAIDTSIEVAMDSINNARKVGSVINETRVEKLYLRMSESKYNKLPAIRMLGEVLSAT